jgi:hypothetical protein
MLEALETRLAPAVSAVQSGAILDVNLTDMKDQAVLSGFKENASILVVGFDANGEETFRKDFTGVKSINVHGGGGDLNQWVKLLGAAELAGNLSVDGIRRVQFASWRIDGNMNITTVGEESDIFAASSSLTVVGSTTLSSAYKINVTGANDFQGPVSLSAGSQVRLDDAKKLTLAKLSVYQDVTLAAGQLALTGNSRDYYSQTKGALFLRAASPTQTMTIGGDTAESYLSQDDITKLGASFGRLVIGDTGGTPNPIDVLGMSYYTQTEIRTENVLTVNGEIQTGSRTAGLVLDALGGTVLNAGIRTRGGTVDLSANGPLTLGTPGTIEISTTNGAQGGGAIRLGAVNDDDTPTVLRLAGGDVTFRGNVGDVKPVAGVEIATAHAVTFAGSMKAGYIKQERGTGVTTLHDVVVTGSEKQPVALDITTSRVSLLGNVKAAGRTVEFHVSDGVDQGGTKGLTAAALALTGKGSFLLNGDHNNVDTLAANVAGTLSFRDLHDLTVGTVEGIYGITNDRHDVTLEVGGQLTIGNSIKALSQTITLIADGGVLERGGGVVGFILRLEGLGTFDLSSAANYLAHGHLFAEIRGNLYFTNNVGGLYIGDGVAPIGISTGGGNVWIKAGTLWVKSAINTQPGSGGGDGPIIKGNPSNVHYNPTQIVLGKGTVTFVVPD